ncbi:MAG: hypothetical protein Q7R47_05395, partial [Candidatus Diapherotrites archaeon]|nr:hypothetical protein [Candidatus Diapherotrites archaeon]
MILEYDSFWYDILFWKDAPLGNREDDVDIFVFGLSQTAAKKTASTANSARGSRPWISRPCLG